MCPVFLCVAFFLPYGEENRIFLDISMQKKSFVKNNDIFSGDTLLSSEFTA